jgi:chemotaxis signal transduction protein
MSRAGAWLLALGDFGDVRAAVGVREQVHLMLEPEAAEVAGTPAHCRHVIFWNGRCVPVIDLSRWLDATTTTARPNRQRHLGVYAYQPEANGAVEFGALWLARPPQRIEVDDAAATPLPVDSARWADVAAACFADATGAVPVLDLSRVFSGALAEA